jgi:hypothetical protein
MSLTPAETPLPVLGRRPIGGDWPPLDIIQISGGPDPVPGRLFHMQVMIVSTRDEPATTLRILMPDSVKFEGGAGEWHPSSISNPAQSHDSPVVSLIKNQPYNFDFSICVLYAGNHVIWIFAASHRASGEIDADSVDLFLVTTADSGRAVPGWNWNATAPAGPPKPYMPTPVITPAPCP